MHVSGGSLSEEQVLQQLKKLVPAEFRWNLVLIEENVFKVDFTRKEDRARLMVFIVFVRYRTIHVFSNSRSGLAVSLRVYRCMRFG